MYIHNIRISLFSKSAENVSFISGMMIITFISIYTAQNYYMNTTELIRIYKWEVVHFTVWPSSDTFHTPKN